jgi:hypothetical protein
MPSPAPPSTGVRPAEHPWERTRRLEFERWETELRRRPYGGPLPDVVGFARSIEPPAHWTDPGTARGLFALAALPTGEGPTYLAAVPSRSRPPPDGRLVRLVQPRKKALDLPDSAFGELLIEASHGVLPASWEEMRTGVSAPAASRIAARLAELWRLPLTATELLLLPVVGTTPWHGRPAELELGVECEGWSQTRLRGWLSNLLELTPAWVWHSSRRSAAPAAAPLELVSGVRVRPTTPRTRRPYAIQLRPFSSPPSGAFGPGGAPRSTIRYGHALASEFLASVAAGGSALLLTSAETASVPARRVEIPDDLRALAWGLHWWTPAGPDGPDWHRWLRNELPQLRETLERLPLGASLKPSEEGPRLTDRPEFRDRLAQTAIAHARLRAAAEVEESDLRFVVEAFVRTIERATVWAGMGRGPLARSHDRSEGGRRRRLQRAVTELFREAPAGLSVDDARAGLLSAGWTIALPEVERLLERLRIGGILFQDRAGRYRPV